MNQFSTEEQAAPKMRHHSRWSRAFLSISGLLALGIVAAACSSSPASSGGGGSTTATLVATTKNAKLGTILVNNKGFTLYTLSGNAPCDAACSAVWPPLIATGSAKPNLGGVSGLGTVKVSGGEQVTHNGQRLYTFIMDKSAGQATGQGLTDTWGTWNVVVTQASSTPTSPTTAAPTATTTPGGGGVGF
jgi:predicted lipoprotein with Yx(FWY)xxD motif